MPPEANRHRTPRTRFGLVVVALGVAALLRALLELGSGESLSDTVGVLLLAASLLCTGSAALLPERSGRRAGGDRRVPREVTPSLSPSGTLPPPLPAGARVRVRRDPDFGPGPWPSEPLGNVDSHHLVSTRRGFQRTYWVRFDEPQRDADGDGPYTASEVLEQYLEVVDGQRPDHGRLP